MAQPLHRITWRNVCDVLLAQDLLLPMLAVRIPSIPFASLPDQHDDVCMVHPALDHIAYDTLSNENTGSKVQSIWARYTIAIICLIGQRPFVGMIKHLITPVQGLPIAGSIGPISTTNTKGHRASSLSPPIYSRQTSNTVHVECLNLP
jgi:hypothetical protein